jgi:cysteinyl-tRNA synthetase
MAERFLGPEFDIHGGGLDLRFPHHENEQAQSRAAGDGFAQYWMHNSWVTLGGEKMSKSLGNTALVDEVVQRVRPVELRYYLVAPHYRSTIEFTEAALEEAGAAYRRLESFVRHAAERVGSGAAGWDSDRAGAPVLCADFTNAMDDDLGTPAAIAAVHEAVTAGNTALDAGDDDAVAGALGSVRAMLGVLGLDPLDPQWATAGGDQRLAAVANGLVALALEQRTAARARKDYASADAIRNQLGALGVQVEDTPQGTRWELTS